MQLHHKSNNKNISYHIRKKNLISVISQHIVIFSIMSLLFQTLVVSYTSFLGEKRQNTKVAPSTYMYLVEQMRLIVAIFLS
jgi:hypothetical protein